MNYTKQFAFVLRFVDFRIYVMLGGKSHKEAIEALLAMAED